MHSKTVNPILNYITMLKKLIKTSDKDREIKKQTIDNLEVQIEKIRSINVESTLLKDYCDANCRKLLKNKII
jgi:hypothetical protein